MDWVSPQIVGDLLTLGGVGFVAGLAFPLAARLIGWIVDSVWLILKGGI